MDVVTRILGWLGCWLLTLPAFVMAEPIELADLDWNRLIEQDNIVFVPIKDIQRGPIWYTKYNKVVSKPTSVFSFKKVVVSLYPKAHDENKYYSFIEQHDIRDAKVNLTPPGQQGCQLDPELVEFFSNLPENYQPKLLPGNYPYLCEAMIFYLPEDQSSVFRFLASHAVLKVDMNLAITLKSLPPLSTQDIIEQLALQSVLAYSRPSRGFCTEDQYQLLYQSAKLAQTHSSLFVSEEPYLGWKTFIDLFDNENIKMCIDQDTMLGTTYVKRNIRIQH